MASQPIYAGDTAAKLKKSQDNLINAAKLLESANKTINDNLSGAEFAAAIKYIEKIMDLMSDEVDDTNTALNKLTDLVNNYNSNLYDDKGNKISVSSVNYRSGKKLTYAKITPSTAQEVTGTSGIKGIDASTDVSSNGSASNTQKNGTSGNNTYNYSTGGGSRRSYNNSNGSNVANYNTYSYTSSSAQSGHITDYKDYIVAEGATSLSDYVSFLRSKGICQDTKSEYGGKCLGFAYTQAYGYFINDRSLVPDNGKNYKYATKFRGVDGTKEQILTEIYNEIKAGRPVILQVNGNKSGTSRHFVTVVGFKKTVQSASELKETDLLILDSWDARIETMNGKGSGTRFMTQGTETGNGNYGYRIYKMR